MGEWQPIETEPKDGDWFIAAWDGKVTIAKWLDNSDGQFASWEGYVVPSMFVRPRAAEPSHWMPLPEPPT